MRGTPGGAGRLWRGPGGMGEVLSIGYPLVLSQMSFTVQVFVDRLFLTWYSAEAVAGAVTGLFVTWSVVGLSIGTGEDVTTFVAQYYGARRFHRMGAALWQGIYLSVMAGALDGALSPCRGGPFTQNSHVATTRATATSYCARLWAPSWH